MTVYNVIYNEHKHAINVKALYLEVFVLFALFVEPLPNVIRLVCRHIGMDGVFSRWRQRGIKNGGNGDDAHILRRLQILPIIDNQMVTVQIRIQTFCIDACMQRCYY